jgi:hypothetical protein
MCDMAQPPHSEAESRPQLTKGEGLEGGDSGLVLPTFPAISLEQRGFGRAGERSANRAALSHCPPEGTEEVFLLRWRL